MVSEAETISEAISAWRRSSATLNTTRKIIDGIPESISPFLPPKAASTFALSDPFESIGKLLINAPWIQNRQCRDLNQAEIQLQ